MLKNEVCISLNKWILLESNEQLMLLCLLDVFRVGMSARRQYVVAHERPFRQKNELSYSVTASNLESHLILLPVASCVAGTEIDYERRYSYSDKVRRKQNEVRQCLLSFCVESFFFQLAI